MDGIVEDPSRGQGAGAGTRVMREIIRTPAFLEIIKTNMASIDPDGAKAAVYTMLWEDPELTLSLASTAPEVINCLVEAILELGRQLNQFPAPLLDAFLDQLMGGVDVESLRELPATYAPLMEKVEFQRRATAAFGAGINAVASWINRANAKNPYFVRDSMEAVDGREVARAAWAVTKSVALWCFSRIKTYIGVRHQY
jgi:hypothetical protein